MSNGINFNNFLMKQITANIAALNSDDDKSKALKEKLENITLFESVSAEDLQNIDFEALLSSDEISNEMFGEEATDEVKAFGDIVKSLMSIEGVQTVADADKDGEVSQAEVENFLKSAMNFDGDAESLTMDDIDGLLQNLNIDLSEVADEAIKEIEETQTPEEVQQAQQASSTPGGSSNAAGRTASPSSTGTTTNNKTATQPQTKEEIEQAISDKNDEITNIQDTADKAIEEQEKLKEDAMKQAGLDETQLKEYQEKEKELDTKIQDKETAISDQENIISDKQSTMASNEAYIGDLDAQISSNQSKLSSISSEDENADSKKSEIEGYIKNLQEKKAEIEKENTQLQKDIETANIEKTRLASEKEQLEGQKDQLLVSTMNNGLSALPADVVQKQTDNIRQFDTEIASIKADAQSKIAGVKGEIQTLQTQLKTVETQEERTQFLKDNNFKQGLGLTGEELVDVAKQMLNQYGSSTGYCATGVSRTFQMAYGLELHGNGCDWTANMDNLVEQGYFEEVTGDYASSADLANLPAGAVVSWDATGGTEGGAKYGHVTIADGQGGEISDHYAKNIYQSIGGRRDTYHVYIPVT